MLNRDAMSYQKAQALVDDTSDTAEIADSICQLLGLSRRMGSRTLEAGALKLASAQLHFVLDCEIKEPPRGELYEPTEVYSLVEEFMLFANISGIPSGSNAAAPRGITHRPLRVPEQGTEAVQCPARPGIE
jgi:exoribonuclease R